MGHASSESSDYLNSAVCYERAGRIAPEAPHIAHATATAWLHSGLHDRALKEAMRFKELTHGNQHAWLLIASICERTGKAEEAWEALRSGEMTEDLTPTVSSIASKLLIQEKKYGEAIDVIKRFLEWGNSRFSKPHDFTSPVVDAWFMLVKAYNKLGEYDEAWKAAETAHALVDAKWNPEKTTERFEQMRKFMTRDTVKALAHASEHHEQPVFIVGNPRSGTSLLEQILSMHPSVRNAGELITLNMIRQKCPQTIDSFLEFPKCLVDMRVTDADEMARSYMDHSSIASGDSLRVTNKSLALHAQVGFLSLILPKSHVIMLHRHPIDNCISCYTTNLIANGHSYTNRLEWLAHMVIERKRMQDYWMETLDIPMLELHYDRLVADQENETRRLLDFLDLEWEPDCMEFHKSKHVASTISYDQVNKKMYTSSSGRWKNYEKHIGPLLDAFSDYID